MDQEPFFPPPRVQGYREAAERPLDPPSGAQPSAPPTSKARVVVSRPQVDPDDAAKESVAARARRLVQPASAESAYWREGSLLARHPRPFGALVLLLGAWSVWSSVSTLLHGGYYWTRGVAAGPVLVMGGIYILLTGYKPTSDWRAGLSAFAVLGLLLGLVLLHFM